MPKPITVKETGHCQAMHNCTSIVNPLTLVQISIEGMEKWVKMVKIPRKVGFAGQCSRVELLPFLMSSLQPQTRGGWPCVHTWLFFILCNCSLSQFSEKLCIPAFLHTVQLFSNLLYSLGEKWSHTRQTMHQQFAYHIVMRHTPPLCVLSALHTSLASVLYSRQKKRQKILKFCCDSFSALCIHIKNKKNPLIINKKQHIQYIK